MAFYRTQLDTPSPNVTTIVTGVPQSPHLQKAQRETAKIWGKSSPDNAVSNRVAAKSESAKTEGP